MSRVQNSVHYRGGCQIDSLYWGSRSIVGAPGFGPGQSSDSGAFFRPLSIPLLCKDWPPKNRSNERAGRSDQRRRRHALHGQSGHHRRADDADRHLQARHQPRPGAAAGAKPRVAGRAAPAGRGAPARHHDGQELVRPDDGGAPRVAEQPIRHELPAQLHLAQRQGPPGAHRGRGPSADLGWRRVLDARLARPAEGGRARPVGRRRGARDPRAERAGRGRCGRCVAGPARCRSSTVDQRPWAPAERGGVRRHHRQERRRRRRDAAARHRPAGTRRCRLFAALAARQRPGGGHRRVPGTRIQRAADLGRGAQDDGGAQAVHARGRRVPHRL